MDTGTIESYNDDAEQKRALEAPSQADQSPLSGRSDDDYELVGNVQSEDASDQSQAEAVSDDRGSFMESLTREVPESTGSPFLAPLQDPNEALPKQAAEAQDVPPPTTTSSADHEAKWLKLLFSRVDSLDTLKAAALGDQQIDAVKSASSHKAVFQLARAMSIARWVTAEDSTSNVSQRAAALLPPAKDNLTTMAELNDFIHANLADDTATADVVAQRVEVTKMFAEMVEQATDNAYTAIAVGSAASGIDGKDSDLDLGIARIGADISDNDGTTEVDEVLYHGMFANPNVSSKHVETMIPRGVTDFSRGKRLIVPDMNNFKEEKVILRLLGGSKKWSVPATDILLKASAPLAKFDYNGLDVDLCPLSLGSLHNPRLAWVYGQHCPAFVPLARIVKLWAKRRCLVGAPLRYVNSWTLVLLVTQYLQLLGLLPAVHTSSPSCPVHIDDANAEAKDQVFLREGRPGHLDVEELHVRKQTELLIEPLGGETGPTHPSVGELFLGFLAFYGCVFDYSSHAISVRRGHLLPLKWTQRERDHVLHVEEPFEVHSNTARALREDGLACVTYEMKRALLLILTGAPVKDIFEPWDFSCKKLLIVLSKGPHLLRQLLPDNVDTQPGDMDPVTSTKSALAWAMFVNALSPLCSDTVLAKLPFPKPDPESGILENPELVVEPSLSKNLMEAGESVLDKAQQEFNHRLQVLGESVSDTDSLKAARAANHLKWLWYEAVQKLQKEISKDTVGDVEKLSESVTIVQKAWNDPEAADAAPVHAAAANTNAVEEA